MTRPLTIAVTGLNATDNPGPGVGVVRALRASGAPVRIVALAYDALEPGLYAQGLVDAAYLIPYPSHGVEALAARLRHIHATIPLDVVIPTLDSELPGFIAIADVLDELGIGRFLPTADQLALRSKAHLSELCREAGLPSPPARVIGDPSDLYRLPSALSWPLWIKGAFYGAERATSPDEAIAAWHRVAAKWGLPVIAQVEVRGTEVDVTAVGDGEGGLIGAVPMTKTMLTDKGKGWAGIATGDAEALRLTRKFMAATSWRGPCELELIRDADGEYHLLEINPRFPAWCFLTAGAGQNLPWAVARRAAGEPLPALGAYRVGTMFVRISLDQIADLSTFEALATDGEWHAPDEETP